MPASFRVDRSTVWLAVALMRREQPRAAARLRRIDVNLAAILRRCDRRSILHRSLGDDAGKLCNRVLATTPPSLAYAEPTPRLSTAAAARNMVFMVFVLPHCGTGAARQCVWKVHHGR